MKQAIIIILMMLALAEPSAHGVIDNRIDETLNYETFKETPKPTEDDVWRIINEIKVIRSKIQLTKKEEQFKAFFKKQPYKVLDEN